MSDEVQSDPAFTAYCAECDEVTVMENIAHVVKCHGCGFLVIDVND